MLGGKEEMLEEVRRLQTSPEAKSTILPLLQRELYEYIRFGGYPDVVTETEEEEKIDILKDLRDSFVKKDIEDAGIKDEDAFYRLMQILASQVGGLTNNTELGKMLRMKNETVVKYMDVMEKSFHIVRVKPFFRNLEKELVDFVLPMQNPPLAYEVKKNEHAADVSKYKTFREAYPEFVFRFLWLEPFSEEVLRI